MSLNGGYAMIKYNSTQEELQIAYRSKKPALFYDENQRAHWAVIEETATQSVDEETQEPITLYEYSYRLLDEESGGSGTITLDDIVDSQSNNRFIEGVGVADNVDGITIISSKWKLNGKNLIFEIMGSFNKAVSSNTRICRFILPEWLSNKISPLVANIIDITYNIIASTSGGASALYVLIYKYSNALDFVISSGASSIESTEYCKIRYNIIIE